MSIWPKQASCAGTCPWSTLRQPSALARYRSENNTLKNWPIYEICKQDIWNIITECILQVCLTPIQLQAVHVYMNYHFLKACWTDCFDLSVMWTDLSNLYMYCLFCWSISLVLWYLLWIESFFFLLWSFLFMNVDYNSSVRLK